MRHKARTVASVLVSLLAASCSQKTPQDQSGTNSGAASNSSSEDYANLLAAAEPFEALTEQAFSAEVPKLGSLLADAQTAANSIRAALPATAAEDLGSHLADAKTAIAGGERAQIALSAVEGYRVIVNQFPESGRIPRAVSLLDYAGFRIQADLQAAPVRWDDASRTLAFAKDQWADVSGRITDVTLVTRFSSTLSQLDQAIMQKTLESAQMAAVRELDQVDELEVHFGDLPQAPNAK